MFSKNQNHCTRYEIRDFGNGFFNVEVMLGYGARASMMVISLGKCGNVLSTSNDFCLTCRLKGMRYQMGQSLVGDSFCHLVSYMQRPTTNDSPPPYP